MMHTEIEARTRGAPGAPPVDETRAWYLVIVLLIAYVVSFIDRLILGLLVQPIKAELGVTDMQIGLLAGLGFALFYTVLGVPIARLADRGNRKWLIIGGVVIWSAMTAISAFADSFLELLLARIGVGVGEAVLAPAAASMIADSFARDRVARAIGVYSIGVYLGAGLALLAGSAVVAAVSGGSTVAVPFVGELGAWRLAFLLAALPGIGVALLMLTVREPPRTDFATGAAGGNAPATLRELAAFLRSHRRLLVAHFVAYGSLGTVVTAWLVWAPEMLRRAHDVPIGQAGTVYGLLLVVFGALGPSLGGWLAQRAALAGHADAELRVSLFATLGLLPVVVAAPFMPGLFSAALLLAPLVLLLSLPQGLAPAVLQLIAPNRLRAQVLSAFILCAVLAAYTVGPTAVPLFAQHVFGSERALDRALALLGVVLLPLAAAALQVARQPYREAMRAGGR